MSDMINGSEPKKMVRYCIQGHEIVYTVGEIIRSVCPYCKSPVDRRRPPVAYEEVQRIKAEQAAEEERARTAQETDSSGETLQNTPSGEAPQNDMPGGVPQNDMFGGTPQNDMFGGAPQNNMFGQSPQESMLNGMQPGFPGQRPGGFGQGQGSFHTGMPGGGFRSGFSQGGFGQNRQPGGFGQNQTAGGFGQNQQPGGFRPGMPGTAGRTPGPMNGFGQGAGTYAASGFYLSLYGERIAIPAEGAWIGREGLGREWFDGNLMISRKHVYVRPNPQTGRLQVNEDKSLNGVFFSGPDGKRERLTSARMMGPGEILWIYNVPLRIER